MKNDCHLFQTLFKVEKNGLFLFGISFFLDICMLLYYANEESDDNNLLHSNNKILNQENLQKYWSNVLQTCTRKVHHKRNKVTPTMLLPWQYSWLQSLSVKKQISGTECLSRNTHASHNYRLYSPHQYVGSVGMILV